MQVVAATSDKSVPVISKKGNADLRYGLYQAGLIASYRNKDFRKLLVIAGTMLKNNEPFDPSRLAVESS